MSITVPCLLWRAVILFLATHVIERRGEARLGSRLGRRNSMPAFSEGCTPPDRPEGTQRSGRNSQPRGGGACMPEVAPTLVLGLP